MVMKRSFGEAVADAIIYTFLALSALLCIAPVINTIAISFSDTAAAAAGMVTFWPVKPTMASYAKLVEDLTFFRAFGISTVRVVVGTTLNMALIVMMAYPLSRDRSEFRQRSGFMWFVVVAMLFSGGLIPYYLTVRALGMIDSIWALILPGAVPLFNVILMMNFFRGVPKELCEAAQIDGAGPWRIAFRIFVPISLPAIATVALFCVVGHWNDFFSGLIFMNKPENYPLQTYIQQLVVAVDFSKITDPIALIERMKVSSKTFNAAKIMISMLPILCVYPFLQKYFVTGMVLGSVKE